MFQDINAQALNHLLRQNPWTRDSLCRFAGKTVRLALPPIMLDLAIDPNGEFFPAADNVVPDATLSIAAPAALRFLLERKLENTQIELAGDTELASEVGRVLRNLNWEYEEDLSRVIGDVPAQQLVSLGKRAITEGKRQAESIAGMLAEYWQEEQPLIAKRRHLEQFTREVDALRDDAERLAKRLQKLRQKV